MASLLERNAQAALMLRARAGFPARLDFATIGDVTLHKAAGVLVINLTHMVMAKLANFAASAAFTAPASLAARSIRSSMHELAPLFPATSVAERI
jgi:hypothetical protein